MAQILKGAPVVEALNNNTLVMEQIKEVLTNGERK